MFRIAAPAAALPEQEWQQTGWVFAPQSYAIAPLVVHAASGHDSYFKVVDQAGTNVVLIVDEVQHAITSDDGNQMLLALKAARDAINPRPGTPGHFIFIGTGSHRALVRGTAQYSGRAPVFTSPPFITSFVDATIIAGGIGADSWGAYRILRNDCVTALVGEPEEGDAQ